MASMFTENSAEPNLVPILDMVFQLITFFMLVVNFQEASVDVSLRLPVVGSARPVDTEGVEEVLVLNIDESGVLKVYGTPTEMETYIAREGRLARDLAKVRNPTWKPNMGLPVTVVIRADQRIPFSKLNQVMTSCQREGYRKLSLKTISSTPNSGGGS